MSSSVLLVGSMTSMFSEPALCYDWVVPDFLNLTGNVYCKGPVFVVQNKIFCFRCWTGDKFFIWIERLSGPPTVLARISLNLVMKYGSEKLICSAKNFEDLVGRLAKADLTPYFLPNGELRVRCRVEVQGELAAKVASMHGRTLLENLRKEFADQSGLTFTDCVLVSIISRS